MSIYLDNNATTAIDPAVREMMLRYLGSEAGNPSSRHASGRWARQGVEEACEKIAEGLDVNVDEITFTSGATEANNLAILSWRRDPSVVYVSATEHPSALLPAESLASFGHDVRVLTVDEEGLVDLSDIDSADARGVIQWANSETGTIQELITSSSSPDWKSLHVDGVQAVGKVPISFRAIKANTLSFSGHKIHGPPGIGALLVRKGTSIDPLLLGGSQQAGIRPGSEPVALIAGLGEAVRLATISLAQNQQIMRERRDFLESALAARVPQIVVHGSRDHRLPGTLNVSFLGAKAEAVLMGLDLAGVRASAGTACASGSMEPSPTLVAMGLAREQVMSAIRFSVSRQTTADDIIQAIDVIEHVVEKIRAKMSVYPADSSS
ncbi:cysteine desulfurase [bacterium]|nr:cysteine desulfurase [bacterium]